MVAPFQDDIPNRCGVACALFPVTAEPDFQGKSGAKAEAALPSAINADPLMRAVKGPAGSSAARLGGAGGLELSFGGLCPKREDACRVQDHCWSNLCFPVDLRT